MGSDRLAEGQDDTAVPPLGRWVLIGAAVVCAVTITAGLLVVRALFASPEPDSLPVAAPPSPAPPAADDHEDTHDHDHGHDHGDDHGRGQADPEGTAADTAGHTHDLPTLDRWRIVLPNTAVDYETRLEMLSLPAEPSVPSALLAAAAPLVERFALADLTGDGRDEFPQVWDDSSPQGWPACCPHATVDQVAVSWLDEQQDRLVGVAAWRSTDPDRPDDGFVWVLLRRSLLDADDVVVVGRYAPGW